MSTPYQLAVLADGAVAFVPGNELVQPMYEIVRNIADAAAAPHPTLGNPAPTGLGSTSAGFYNGPGQVDASWPNPFTIAPASALSVEAWFSSTGSVGGSGGLASPAVLLFADVSGTGQYDWGLGFSGNMQPSWGMGNPTTSADDTITAPDNGYNDGNWHQAVATWDGATGIANLYVDTVLVATSSAFYQGTTFGAGYWSCGSNGANWTGFAGNWAIYPSALTPTQIENHYNLIFAGIIVPNVVGLAQADAETALTNAQFTVGTITDIPSGSVPIGTVVSQSPTAGSSGTIGETVALDVSAGLTIPNVENLSEAIAKEVLISAGFTLGLVTYVSSVLVIPGNVVTQLPVAGTQANGGTPVSVALSQGRIAVPVPDLIGLTEAEAIAALTNLGLVPGAIGMTASTTVAAGIVISQNIGPGIPYPIIIAVGSLVGFVVSSGPPSTDTLFSYEPTVISQYANSPTLLQWIDNMNQYMDQSANFANFLSYVWNVDSAVGFGLDIWGKIVNVSRLLRIPNTTPYVGFDISSESQPDQDWTPAGSSQPPYNNPPVGGAMYTGHNATEAYLLDDNAYRQLILAKAFANICSTTAPALNQILQNLYGVGQAYVLSSGLMAITYNFNFTPSPIQLAILQQSGVIPTPPGVAFSIVVP